MEYKTFRDESGRITFEEYYIYREFYYKFIYYSIVDPLFRY